MYRRRLLSKFLWKRLRVQSSATVRFWTTPTSVYKQRGIDRQEIRVVVATMLGPSLSIRTALVGSIQHYFSQAALHRANSEGLI